MKLFGRKQYVIGVIIVALVIALVIFSGKARSEPLPVISDQFGPFTYIVAIEKECNGVPVDAGVALWMPRYISTCDTKYYHMVSHGNHKPLLVGVTTNTIPTQQLVKVMIRRYITVIISGGM